MKLSELKAHVAKSQSAQVCNEEKVEEIDCALLDNVGGAKVPIWVRWSMAFAVSGNE